MQVLMLHVWEKLQNFLSFAISSNNNSNHTKAGVTIVIGGIYAYFCVNLYFSNYDSQ